MFSEKQFCSLSVWDLYAILLGYFGLKFLPDVRHCFYWVLVEIWALDSSHETVNKFCIHHCQGWEEGSFVCETVWYFSWVNTHSLDLKFVAFCLNFRGDSSVEFKEKNISGEFFINFVQTKAILCQNLWNFAIVSVILFCVRIAMKKLTQVLSYVVCTQARRHVHKEITKRIYGGENPGSFVFGKTVLFTLGIRLLGPTPWVFWSQIFTRLLTLCLLSFCLELNPRFVPRDCQ